MREDMVLKTRFIDDDLPNIPTNWLKVIKKYASIINRSLSRDISVELDKRNAGQGFSPYCIPIFNKSPMYLQQALYFLKKSYDVTPISKDKEVLYEKLL